MDNPAPEHIPNIYKNINLRDKICLIIFLGCINPNKNGNNFKTIKIRNE